MKALTVGRKIIMGFAALVTIALLLGAVSILKMSGVSKKADTMHGAYVPEVKISNEIERTLTSAMYANRGFGYTGNQKYFKEAQGLLQEVHASLDDAQQLATDQGLPGLAAALPEMVSSVEQYEGLAKETSEVFYELEDVRKVMDTAAATFVSACSEMLLGQDKKLKRDIADRTQKVTLISELVDSTTVARVNNFKAMSTEGETKTRNLKAVEKGLNQVQETADALLEICVVPSDRKILSEITKASETYQDAVSDYHDLARSNPESTELKKLNTTMDEAAEILVKRAHDFQVGQIQKLERDISERVSKLEWVNNIIDLGNAARITNFKAQAMRDPAMLNSALENLDAMDAYYAKLEPITRDPEDIDLLKKTDEASHAYADAITSYKNLSTTLAELGNQRNETGGVAVTATRELANLGISHTTDIAESTSNEMRGAINFLSVMLAVAIIVGCVLAYFITSSITRPLMEAIKLLTNGASETGSAAGQVSSASQSLAEGASEQAASLEETTSSLDEIASMVNQNAELAVSTNERATQARQSAAEGVNQVTELRGSADIVSDSAKEMETAMHAIKESSDSISKIIKTIDEIAFQTNILALNAAVEAARAGEAGAGFAVVADEVRSLAHRAADAARETATMIEDSMERSERGVKVNETVGENLQAVLSRASDVEAGLQDISEAITGVSQSMGEMESSIREQRDGIDQINTGMNQVNDVTQGNAASAEQAASAAEEMNAQSVHLTEIVDTLNLMVVGRKTQHLEIGKNPEMDFEQPSLADRHHVA